MENLDTPDDFLKLVGKSVSIFQTKIPECELDEVFVEYHSDIHRSKLIRNGLELSTVKSEILEPGKFCIDGIINTGKNAEPNNGLAIFSCRSRDLCNEMPCVRRCCSNQQMMERVNGSINCVEHARNIKPTFHDIASSVNETDFSVVEPRGNFFHYHYFV